MSDTVAAIYVSIGNSDDRLPQATWAKFVHLVITTIRAHANEVHGVWFSAPDSEFQNACVCFRLDSPTARIELRGRLTALRYTYGQNAVAWAEVADTAMI